jgi:hypothetical protein
MPASRRASRQSQSAAVLIGCPSFAPVSVSKPAITTEPSSTAKASELSRVAVRGLSKALNAPSKYARICSGFVSTAFPSVPIIKAGAVHT